MKNIRRAAAQLIAALSLTALAGCSSPSPSGGRDALERTYPQLSPQECRTLLDQTMGEVRAGATNGRVDDQIGMLSEACPDEMDVFTGYAASSNLPFEVTCDEIAGRTHPDALVMFRQDGHCKEAAAAGAVPAGGWPEGGLGWNEAPAYAGTYQRVCGPLAGMRNTADGTFVNVGLDYPDPGRFTFIFWGYQGQSLPATAVLCASGTIYMYEGTTAQMEVGSPDQLEIWN